MALHVGTRYPRPLLGVMVLSGYEVLADTRDAEASAANRTTPMLFCHGTLDPLVAVGRGRQACRAQAGPERPRELPLRWDPPTPWWRKWWVWAIAGTGVAAVTGAVVYAAQWEPSDRLGGSVGTD